MDINKYLTNKDIQLSNEDINFEKLEKDIRKGYVSSEEIENTRKSVTDELNKNYSQLEDKYNQLQKSYADIEARNTQLTSNENKLKLEVEMTSQGFKKEQFEEIETLRNSLFKDEQDNAKAISMIKEKYKATYFPETSVEVPNETSFETSSKPKEEIKVTRKTSIRDLLR
jgi:hypothetical protein